MTTISWRQPENKNKINNARAFIATSRFFLCSYADPFGFLASPFSRVLAMHTETLASYSKITTRVRGCRLIIGSRGYTRREETLRVFAQKCPRQQ